MEEQIQPRRICILLLKCSSLLKDRDENCNYCRPWGLDDRTQKVHCSSCKLPFVNDRLGPNVEVLYRVSIKSFPDYKHLLQENYCTCWNTNIFFKCYSRSFFYNTLIHACASFIARRTSNRQSISLHVFSNMSSVTVANASVILAFKFVISGTGVENTLSLTYPHKKKSRGVISGDRSGQGVGPSLPIYLFGNFASKNQMFQ